MEPKRMNLKFAPGMVVKQKNGQLFKILAADEGLKGPFTSFYILVPLPERDYNKAITMRTKNAHRRFVRCIEGEVLYG